jgi:hypothetical protein
VIRGKNRTEIRGHPWQQKSRAIIGNPLATDRFLAVVRVRAAGGRARLRAHPAVQRPGLDTRPARHAARVVPRPVRGRDRHPERRVPVHGRFTVRHYDQTFNLDALDSAWFVVEPFHASVEGPAHTLMSFGFADGKYVAISVEIRKEPGEKFSPLLGLLKRYELMYVIADERDVIKLRSNYRKDDVFLYPARTSAENRRRMFVEMLERANTLAEHPEFYNTLTNTCTTNIVRHVNTISEGRVPWSYKVLLPAYSDELAYDLGLIDTTLPLDEARRRFRINDRAARYADDPEFSRRIRGLD